jgi:hypothetical protein
MTESLRALADRVGADLQTLEDRIRVEGERRLKIRFPRGFLRKAECFRAQYWFIRDENLRRNIAYTLILSDVYRWILNRTDLWGTAREMIIKEGVCLIGALCESITKDAAKDICSEKAGLKRRTAAMTQQGMISSEEKKAVDDLWDWRNRQHLFLLNDWEYNKYTLKQYNDAIRTLRGLRMALDNYFRNMETPF